MPLEMQSVTLYGVAEALLAMSAFVMLLAVGSLWLPGAVHPGPPGDGVRRSYKLNGLLLFALMITAAAVCHWSGLFPLNSIPPRLPALAVSANVLAFAVSAVLLARGGNRDRPLADFFFGSEW